MALAMPRFMPRAREPARAPAAPDPGGARSIAFENLKLKIVLQPKDLLVQPMECAHAPAATRADQVITWHFV